MKYIDGFRDPGAAAALSAEIAALAAAPELKNRRVAIMEVCGSHTMAIARYGIREILPPNIELISGPGCPVCVTEAGYIDAAVKLADRGVLIASFGDMIRVRGSELSLADCRARGGTVEVCYSPAAALELAAAHPGREVVFLAVGFETTIAPVTSLVPSASRRGLGNLSLLTAFKLVPPALTALLADPELAIDAFLCPAHVSAIIGAQAYLPFTGAGGVPCVIAGFEPLDILLGVRAILRQVLEGEARLDNQYSRVVKPQGNLRAQAVMAEYLEPVDAVWRGLGRLPASGLGLRPGFAAFDAEKKLGLSVRPGREDPRCLCGEVIKGKRKPPDCPLFAAACRPEQAVGPCMVSSEGSCAAYYKYLRFDT
jgi:hydrogenase expression/formation protein HypD